MAAFDRRAVLRRGHGGFSLIEVLVVIAVLAVLAAVIVFSIGSSKGKAEAAACKIELRTLRTAVQEYRATTGYYPSTQASLVDDFLDAPTSRWNYIAPADLEAGPPSYSPTGSC